MDSTPATEHQRIHTQQGTRRASHTRRIYLDEDPREPRPCPGQETTVSPGGDGNGLYLSLSRVPDDAGEEHAGSFRFHHSLPPEEVGRTGETEDARGCDGTATGRIKEMNRSWFLAFMGTPSIP